jgi:hypothetical protein
MMIATYGLGTISNAVATQDVITAFQNVLNRTPDPAGLTSVINQIMAGTLTESGYEANLLESAEYLASKPDQAHYAALHAAPVEWSDLLPTPTNTPAPVSMSVAPVVAASVPSVSVNTTPSVSVANTSAPSVSSNAVPSVNTPAIVTVNATQPTTGSTDMFPSFAMGGFSGTDIVFGGVAVLLVLFMMMKK